MNSEMSPLTRDFAEVIAPLGEDEERRAVEAALAHLGLRRPSVYGVELRIDKNRRSLPRRRIGVLLGELDGYLPYEVVVSDDAAVVSATARPDLMPPFSDEEVAGGGRTCAKRGAHRRGGSTVGCQVRAVLSLPPRARRAG